MGKLYHSLHGHTWQCGANCGYAYSMHLEGSCHCGRVQFQLESTEPYPFMRCYCGICRKTAGGGGFCINLGGDAQTLQVQGRGHVKIYRAVRTAADGTVATSPHERHFCGECGSHLWAQNPQWPELVHPVAGAIDTPLPAPPSSVHLMTDFKPDWVPLDDTQTCFAEYPDFSLKEWHQNHQLE